ncbi:MAG: NAD(P)-binding domain-containing protein [Saprospiraceae bacterium]|nr:NAD(P)-binding domain-containing protein [Saprospiraceae bacterium]
MDIELLIYIFTFLVIGLIVFFYLYNISKKEKKVEEKITKAIEFGIHEPISLHPVIDLDTCIGSAACIKACPEQDVLGLKDGKATLINATHCVGHGACFHACPVEAISLRIGTEKRGVDLPHVSQTYETNVKGVYIAGELGGMGLIKNSVEQGKQAMQNITASIKSNHSNQYDVIIIGAGPAGISASLQAKKDGLKCITLEQDSLGGTVFNFPRAKVVMTAPMDLPLYGKVKLVRTNKSELLDIWVDVISKHDIPIQENTKVEQITAIPGGFEIMDKKGNALTSHSVLIAIGRRGSPRKLGVPGEQLEKVAYRLLEPELIKGKQILVVGGGDSAIESALLLAENNQVQLSYRGEKFGRLKPENSSNILKAATENRIKLLMQSNVLEILENKVIIKNSDSEERLEMANDLVYIFAGGELPTDFLQKTGIQITKRFGYTVRSHKK